MLIFFGLYKFIDLQIEIKFTDFSITSFLHEISKSEKYLIKIWSQSYFLINVNLKSKFDK